MIVSIKFSKETKEIDLFGKQISMHIAASDPLALESSQINEDVINKEKMLIRKVADLDHKISLIKNGLVFDFNTC